MPKNNRPSVAIGSKIDVARPLDPRAMSGEASVGRVVLVDGKLNLVIALATYEPGQHPQSPLKEHLHAIAIHTPNTVVWVGAPSLWLDPAETTPTWAAWDRRPRTVQDAEVEALVAEVANF